MELKEYLAIARKWWWLLVLGAILGTSAGFVAGTFKTVTYQTRTTLVIGSDPGQRFNPDESQLATSERLGQIYAEMVRREPILRAASDNLELNRSWTSLRDQVRGQPVPGTLFFELYVTDTDPVRAKRLADEIAQQLVLQSTMANQPSAYEDFIKGQLVKIETKVQEAEQQIQELQAVLDSETTAEGIRRRREEIASLEAKIDLWQSNYASLLAFVEDAEEVSTMSIIEPAMVPTSPANASQSRDVALAGVVGLMLAGGVAFLLEYLDDTIKTGADVAAVLGWPTLATVVAHSRPLKNFKDRLVITRNPFAPVAEAYRSLRTSLEFADLPNPTVLLVTSLVPGEGKTMTAANLAVAMAQAGRRVILVDADLRHPVINKVFDLPNEVGLTSLLVSPGTDLDTALAPIEDQKLQITLADSGLQVLPSGPVPPNPAELLGSPQMARLIDRLREQADVVIFDSPPLLAVTDPTLLARRAEATLLVLEAGRNSAPACLRGREILARIGVEPLGVVLNRLTSKHTGGYYYHNYYYPSQNGHRPPRKKQSSLLGRLLRR